MAIAQEVRNATGCEFCQARKQALSPYHFEGEHRHSNALPERAVDAVHRVITDQNRITRAWIEDNHSHGLTYEHFVELLGITVIVFSIDEFNRGLGVPLAPLPHPQPGEPDHYRPADLEQDTGYVPMIRNAGQHGEREAGLWPPGAGFNVVRALSLVPEAVRAWFGVAAAQYLAVADMRQFTGDLGRSIDRMQMEIVAGRVSSYNECFY